MLPDAPTDFLPPVPAACPLPRRTVPERVAEAWFWLCTWTTLAAWTAFLGLWVWALILAGEALWGAG